MTEEEPTQLDLVKQYLKLETALTDDDNLLEALITAAGTFIKNTAGKTFEDENSLYDLALKLLVSHWYDNRNAVTDKPVNNLPYSLNAILEHLSLCGEYE